VDRKNLGAVNDLNQTVEFIMQAIKGLAGDVDLDDPEVQQYINWARRKLTPLDKSSHYGAQVRKKTRKP